VPIYSSERRNNLAVHIPEILEILTSVSSLASQVSHGKADEDELTAYILGAGERLRHIVVHKSHAIHIIKQKTQEEANRILS
jgi:hypothetical protein